MSGVVDWSGVGSSGGDLEIGDGEACIVCVASRVQEQELECKHISSVCRWMILSLQMNHFIVLRMCDNNS